MEMFPLGRKDESLNLFSEYDGVVRRHLIACFLIASQLQLNIVFCRKPQRKVDSSTKTAEPMVEIWDI